MAKTINKKNTVKLDFNIEYAPAPESKSSASIKSKYECI
jgi:hypothetical protein